MRAVLVGVYSVFVLSNACTPAQTTEPTTPPVSSSSSGSSSSSSSGSSGTAPASSDKPAASSNTKTLFVSEARVDCEGEGPMKCLQVRESESDPWTLFYSAIDGFTYEEGNKYELKVKVESVGHPPADSSSKKYKLVEVVSKQKVSK